MSNERLQFAKVRGARILANIGSYMDGERILVPVYDPTFRVREQDWALALHSEHLQYGPLSTACIDMAVNGVDGPTPENAAAISYVLTHGWCDKQPPESEEEFRLLLLFFAEYLADQGM